MITTYSKFYYGIVIEENATLLEIKEGPTTYQANLRPGNYSHEQLEDEVARSINTTDAANIYQVSINRLTRFITISADGIFTIPVTTISSAFNVLSVLGFSGADKTGASTYTGTGAIGLVYTPQYRLQEYIAFEYNKEYLNAAVNEAANGTSEIVSFGLVQFMTCNIKYINNYPHADGSPIIQNLNGLSDAISFMDWLINKAAVEFYPNKDLGTYYHCFLFKGTRGSKGVGYTLKEQFNDAGGGYFETGKIEFRLFN